MESFNNSINETTIIRVMIYEIRDRTPDAVKFSVNYDNVNAILFHLRARRYDMISHTYSHLFLLEILNEFEKAENFEECKEILNTINLDSYKSLNGNQNSTHL